MENHLVLEGEGVRLEPLRAEHLPDLLECANDPALWEFTFQPNPFSNERGAQQWLNTALETPDVRTFAIVDKRSGALAGSTRYLDIAAEHRKLEIGWTFVVRRFWRTHVNTEAKY